MPRGRPKGSKNKPNKKTREAIEEAREMQTKTRRPYGEIAYTIIETPPKGKPTLFTYTEDEQGAQSLVQYLENLRPRSKFQIYEDKRLTRLAK